MKIATLVSQAEFTPEDIKRLETKGEFVNQSVKKIKGEEIVRRLKGVDVIILGSSGVKELSGEVLEQCPSLKYITVMGVGTDFIDVRKATELGIKISVLKGVNSQSVAEHTWGTILSLSKRVTEAHIAAKNGETSYVPFLGKELKGKTIGIWGYGQIGSRVGRIAEGFDMKVLTNTRSKDGIEEAEFVEFEKLLGESDVFVVAVPHNEETDKAIGKKQFAMMKDGVIFVNPSREGIVDVDATLEALESGKLFGFGMELDINHAPDQRYYKYSNVVITPHTGFFTEESEARVSEISVDNVIAFVEGNPQNLVN